MNLEVVNIMKIEGIGSDTEKEDLIDLILTQWTLFHIGMKVYVGYLKLI